MNFKMKAEAGGGRILYLTGSGIDREAFCVEFIVSDPY